MKSRKASGFSSLPSKRFRRLVSEQKKTVERDIWFDRARNETRTKKLKRGEGEGKEGRTPPSSFTCAIFRAVFDSCCSFFAPEPHRNGCYAGYGCRGKTIFMKCQTFLVCCTWSSIWFTADICHEIIQWFRYSLFFRFIFFLFTQQFTESGLSWGAFTSGLCLG